MVVLDLIGMLKMSQLSKVMKISSSAEATVFKMEFKYFKKKQVTTPAAALFSMTRKTCKNEGTYKIRV